MSPPSSPEATTADGEPLPRYQPVPEALPPEAHAAEAAPLPPVRWKTNLVLFVATVFSMFLTGALYAGQFDERAGLMGALRALHTGWSFAVPLLCILLTHEFGHYFAARYHRVDASLPYFIPLPVLSPFGTMGAVIHMRGRIRSKNALLDIGAAGPLAGLVVAIPVLIIGLAGSPVRAIDGSGVQEGQSLLYLALKRIVLGPIGAHQDVFLNPVAFAGWSGLFVTALNLIPIAQLDGGHIAYSLFDKRQNRYARWLHKGLLLMFAYNMAIFSWPALRARRLVEFVQPASAGAAWGDIGHAFSNSLFWLMWFGLLHLLMRAGGRDHPPTEPGELSPARRVVAILSLVLFVLLFMPTPWATY